MTPFSIWLRATGYWGIASGLLCCSALVLYASFRPGTRDWVGHGSQSVAGVEISLQTRRSGDAALDVRLVSSSASPVVGRAGFSVPQRALVIDRQFEDKFVPPRSPQSGRFVLETASGRFEWLVGRVFP